MTDAPRVTVTCSCGTKQEVQQWEHATWRGCPACGANVAVPAINPDASPARTSMETEVSMQIIVRLASLVVHVQEMDPSDPGAFQFDLEAAKLLADDPIVTHWLSTIDPALLPSKRSE